MGDVWLATQIPPFLGMFSLSFWGEKQSQKDEAVPDRWYEGTHCENEHSPVVIVDGGWKSSSTDSVANDMNPFTQPRLSTKKKKEEKNSNNILGML